ncbi:methyltransferase [Enterococcus sp. AZ192]|uniref:methyltransferase n=1 Tax=unclassified Enterococcus TaxID=2608891 RepID=UPI003D2806A2
MEHTEKTHKKYYKMIHNYQAAQVFFTALQMDIFSLLDETKSSYELSKELDIPEEKLIFFLEALISCDFINKEEGQYINTTQTSRYLSRNSAIYIGEVLLFREEMTSLSALEANLKEKDYSLIDRPCYDFRKLAELTIPEMYIERVPAFLTTVAQAFIEKMESLKVLDLGGGAGILGIEFSKHYPNSVVTIFETEEVAVITRKTVEEHGVNGAVHVVTGDFEYDEIGQNYDLIIASGILNFVSQDKLSSFIKKLSDSLKMNGKLLIVNQENQNTSYRLSWLSGNLAGIPQVVNHNLEQSLKQAHLILESKFKTSQFNESIYRKEIS